jgi:hypothetical protein
VVVTDDRIAEEATMAGRTGFWPVGRRIATVMLGFAAAAGLVLAVAAPAHAQLIVANDGFEDQPGRWSFTRSGVGSGGFEVNSAYAREGSDNGWLRVTSGFSSVGRSVNLQNGISIRCDSWIYVQTPGATLNIEIIDPATFNYIALETVTLGSTGSGYRQVGAGPWRADIKNVLFRVSLLAGSSPTWVRLDSMGVHCWLG